MEIISKDKQERITKCKCCNTQISYKLEDCFFDLWNKRRLRCPVCNEWIKTSIFDKKVK